jgi:hypothetical protein
VNWLGCASDLYIPECVLLSGDANACAFGGFQFIARFAIELKISPPPEDPAAGFSFLGSL